ncbi:tyrosine-type recombinase/integrase [Rubrivivax sp. RP6-9]|uniref:tyrosine-type recombinase/integrase n=1 Tax=Rubrivivax sp. RP6-9 TaxID=3415750 RepID=UPI003CC5335E
MSNNGPKGGSAKGKKNDEPLLAVGTRVLPESGEPLPEGLSIRSARGIQMSFAWNGERCFETYPGRPTPSLVVKAARRREEVLQLIAMGKFKYEDEFPSSRRASEVRRQQALSRVEPTGPCLDQWFNIIRTSVGPNTEDDYRRVIQYSLKPLPVEVLGIRSPHPYAGLPLEMLPVDEITSERVSLLRNHLFHRQGLSGRRVGNILIPLRGMCANLVQRKLLTESPFEGLKPLKDTRVQHDAPAKVDPAAPAKTLQEVAKFKADKGKADPFAPDEMEAILGEAEGPLLNTLSFWFACGLRTGEVLALQWQDIDLETNQVCIRRSLSRGKLKTLKRHDWRWLPLRPHALAAVKAQFSYSGQQAAWVFPNPATGERYANESKLTKRWKALLAAAGVRYRRPYQCRHTYGSSELSAGEPLLKVAADMGHKDWTMLQKHYGRWIPAVGAMQGAGQGSAVVFGPLWARLVKLIESRQVDPQEARRTARESEDGELSDETAQSLEVNADELPERTRPAPEQ